MLLGAGTGAPLRELVARGYLAWTMRRANQPPTRGGRGEGPAGQSVPAQDGEARPEAFSLPGLSNLHSLL